MEALEALTRIADGESLARLVLMDKWNRKTDGDDMDLEEPKMSTAPHQAQNQDTVVPKPR